MRKKNLYAVSAVCAGLCAAALFACAPKNPNEPPSPPDQTIHTHSYTPNVIAPGCTVDGYTEYRCECGANYTGDKVAAVGHTMNGDECGKCDARATEGLEFKSANEGYIVTGRGSAKGGDIIIPSVHNGSPVAAIAESAFAEDNTLEFVTLPASVKVLGEKAFFGCDALKSVALTAVEEIGTLALSSKNITQVKLPDTLKTIRSTAFGNLVMDEIHIPASVELIEECAFAFCEFSEITVDPQNARYKATGNCLIDTQTNAIIAGCKGMTVPTDGSVTKIADNAFKGLLGMDELVIPDPVTEIGLHAFEDSEIKTLKIGKGLSSIGYGAFRCCKNLESITVEPENAKYTAVGNCVIDKTKKSVVLGCGSSVIPTDANVVTAIGSNAFRDCDLPENFVVPANVTSIGSLAFAYSGLKSVTIYGTLESAGSERGGGAFQSCLSLKNVIIESGVTKICENMFANSGIEHITLPDSVTEIGKAAFALSLLKEITIPSKVTVISESAFSDCIALLEVTIPDTVTAIGASAFANCGNLVKVTLGRNLASIGNLAFNNCNKLTELVNLSGLNIKKSSSKDTEFGNIGYSLATTAHQASSGIKCYFAGEIYTSDDYASKLDVADGFAFYNNGGAWELYSCGLIGDVTLPESYKGNEYDVASGAFAHYTSASGITVKSGVKNFKIYSVGINSSIRSLNISGAEIAGQAILNCKNLKSVAVSDCAALAAYAIYNCDVLEEIKLHNVGNIAGYAISGYDGKNWSTFKNVTRLEITGNCILDGYALMYMGNKETVVVLSDGIGKIEQYAFYGGWFDTVYFTGTRDRWLAMDIGYADEGYEADNVLDACEVYCYSDSAPTGEGNYWRYAADGKTPVKW